MDIDWEKWMTEHGIYIPTTEEVLKARELGQKKVHKERKTMENTGKRYKEYKDGVAEK